MMKKINPSRIALVIGTLALAFGLFAANALAAEPGIVTKDNVQLFLNKERTQVADWKHGGKLYLAVLIDDSLDSEIASQWSDLKAFFAGQPDTTYISVAYARNGAAMLAQDFTNDHELAAKALRLPVGGSAFSRPYLALLHLMKRWPSSADRRSILLISSGIDYFRGGFDLRSPDLHLTISHPPKQNINIWSI